MREQAVAEAQGLKGRLARTGCSNRDSALASNECRDLRAILEERTC